MSEKAIAVGGAAVLSLAAFSFSTGRTTESVSPAQEPTPNLVRLEPTPAEIFSPGTLVAPQGAGDTSWGDGTLFIPGTPLGPNGSPVTCALPWVPEREATNSGGTTCILPGTDAPAWTFPEGAPTSPSGTKR